MISTLRLRFTSTLNKATGAVPHVGGQLTRPGDPYYETIRHWIAQGAVLDLTVPRVQSIRIEPENPVVQLVDAQQQMRVVATYTDGSARDVTAEAFIESGNTECAEVDRASIVTAIRRGEAPLLARYEGNYAATTLTVMGNREGFVWQEQETWNEIDQFVAAKWQRMKIQPSGLSTDDEFIRRVHLDLTGLPPSADAVRAFIARQARAIVPAPLPFLENRSCAAQQLADVLRRPRPAKRR